MLWNFGKGYGHLRIKMMCVYSILQALSKLHPPLFLKALRVCTDSVHL